MGGGDQPRRRRLGGSEYPCTPPNPQALFTSVEAHGSVGGDGDRLALLETPTPSWVAFELVHFHPASLSGLGEGELSALGSSLRSWGEVDAFACYLSGPAWREGQVSDQWIEAWTRSDDRYLRRAALVSTVPLNSKAKGGRGDAARTLSVCDLLRSDRDDLVVKALSWALRELAVRDASAVARYVRENERSLAPRVRREVRNKLETGLKNPRA